MSLATRFTFIVEISWRTCIFTINWLDHLLLMTSYLVTIATDHHLLVSKCARGMNEQLLKTSGIDVLSFRKKTPKNLMGGGGGIHSRPLPCTSEGQVGRHRPINQIDLQREIRIAYWEDNNNLITVCKPLSWNLCHVTLGPFQTWNFLWVSNT